MRVISGTSLPEFHTPCRELMTTPTARSSCWYVMISVFQQPDSPSIALRTAQVFDDGSFSEDSTFLLTDWTAHIPKEVLAKNFQTNITNFDHIPSKELYIFPSGQHIVHALLDIVIHSFPSTEPPQNEVAPSDPAGTVPNPFTYHLSQKAATPLAGGSMKVFDTSVFTVAESIVGVLVNVEPGGMR